MEAMRTTRKGNFEMAKVIKTIGGKSGKFGQMLDQAGLERMRVEREPKKQVGRPRTGKRSNPDFQLKALQLRKETCMRVDLALMEEKLKGNSRDFSELVEDLLTEWLKKRR